MKKTISIAILSVLLMTASVYAGGPDKSPQTVYIEHFSTLAVEEMYRSGVPASITLAQGLLESRYGLSELAVKGNNHFGIKCHSNWNGGKMYHDDDRKGECFRMYSSPEESFRDHSDFLRYRDRYKFLFDLEPTDYKGWAHGLKKAGYATDPAYPQKLIKLIEDYSLHEYDTKPASWAYGQDVPSSEEMHRLERDIAAQKKAESEERKMTKEEKKQAREEKKEEKKAEKARKKAEKEKKHSGERPESPNSIEQARPLTADQREIFHFALTRQMYSLNGVPFVYAADGETYESIAASYNLFMKEILKYNDLQESQTLYPGTIVYLQAKKKQAPAGLDKHIVEEGNETLREISQRYAVRLENLCKMNAMSADRRLAEGEVILLRK